MSEHRDKIIDRIVEFLDDEDLYYQVNERRNIYIPLEISGSIPEVEVFITTRESSYGVYVVTPVKADCSDLEQINALSRFMIRVNFIMMNGGFQMNVHNGEIRYRSYVNCADCLPSRTVIEDSVYGPLNMMIRYSKGIMNILSGNNDASLALALCNEEYA